MGVWNKTMSCRQGSPALRASGRLIEKHCSSQGGAGYIVRFGRGPVGAAAGDNRDGVVFTLDRPVHRARGRVPPLRPGSSMATVRGRDAHGGSPQAGFDAVRMFAAEIQLVGRVEAKTVAVYLGGH